MKKISMIVLLLLFFIQSLTASRVGIHQPCNVINEADAIVKAKLIDFQIEEHKIKNRVCTKSHNFSLKASGVIKGNIPPGTILKFSYMTISDDREPCMRLYYINPPQSIYNKTAGSDVIAAVKIVKRNNDIEYIVTGAFDVSEFNKISCNK